MLSGPQDALYSATSSGYMDNEKWLDYLHHFVSYLPSNVGRPVVLFVDGLDSHISSDALDFCFSNGVVVIQFVAHTSHVCQPADRTIFKSTKTDIGRLEKLLSVVLPQGTEVDKTKFPGKLFSS